MKKIDYNKIIRESKKLGIKPYTLIKRKLNYRKASKYEYTCKECKHLKFLEYKNSLENVLNCIIIGESIEVAARIEYKCVCDAWESINK
jgi:hypothetical protein